jgi:hypothetical protein
MLLSYRVTWSTVNHLFFNRTLRKKHRIIKEIFLNDIVQSLGCYFNASKSCNYSEIIVITVFLEKWESERDGKWKEMESDDDGRRKWDDDEDENEKDENGTEMIITDLNKIHSLIE